MLRDLCNLVKQAQFRLGAQSGSWSCEMCEGPNEPAATMCKWCGSIPTSSALKTKQRILTPSDFGEATGHDILDIPLRTKRSFFERLLAREI